MVSFTSISICMRSEAMISIQSFHMNSQRIPQCSEVTDSHGSPILHLEAAPATTSSAVVHS